MNTSIVASAQSQELTASERAMLLKKLSEIREGAERSANDRFSTALSAFRDAVRSDVAAHNLYMKCTEKVKFTDQKRSSQDFREWKRKHKERENTPEFRRALQHQLSWLLLSIEASAKPDEIESLGRKALEKVDAIMEDHEKLKDHRNILQQDVLSSVFAKAYNINGLKAKDWPKSPLDVTQIYEKLIFPPLRKERSIDLLRSAWSKRIEQEGMMLKNWAQIPDSGRSGMKRDILPPAFEKWQEEKYPELLWEREKDCYIAGGQKQAATNMLSHFGKYLKHKKALKWTEEFQALMSVEETEDEGQPEVDE